MTKSEILGFISKYSLGGNVESVIWKSKDKSISTDFVSTDKTLKGTITMNSCNIEHGEYGIFNTSQLVRMISILDDTQKGSLHTIINKQDGKDIGIQFTDGKMVVNFILADMDVIPKVPELKMTPTFTSTTNITDEFTSRFIKSQSALSDLDYFTVNHDGIGTFIIFGYANTNTNKIDFPIDTEYTGDIQPIHFSSNLMREILVANKGIPGTMEISPVGLCRVKFNTSTYSAEYYLVNKEIGE